MANLILASKREVKSGSQMWHVYHLSENTKSDEFFFALPIKALKYAFLFRRNYPQSHLHEVNGGRERKQGTSRASRTAGEPPEAEQAAEQSALAKAFEQMKSKHPDAVLLFRMGDFYGSFADDAKTLSEVLGIALTRTSRKNITAQMAGFPHHALDSYLPKLVRAGKRVAICDEPSAPQESAPKKKATRKSAKKESK